MKIYSLFAGALALAFAIVLTVVGADPALAMSGEFGGSALGAIGMAGAAGTGRMIMTAAERAKGRVMRGPDHPTVKKTAAELAAETKAAFEQQLDTVKGMAEKALAEAEKGVKLDQADKDKIDEALTEFNGTKARLEDLEQKLARDNGRGDDRMTAGERFIGDESFKAFAGETRPRGRVQVDVKDITSLTTDAAGSVGTLVQPDRTSPVPLPQRRMTIRALLAPGTTSSNTVEYDREVGFTNNAETTAEGAAKPQSEIQFEEATAKVVTIAHWMRASVQILDDAPALQSIIDNRLRYGLAFKEEVKLLNGPGGSDLEGLVTAATAYAAPSGLTAAHQIDTARLAMLQVALAEYPANGIVMNPIDWAVIELLKDANDNYLIGQPQGMTPPTLWGLPVVPTQAMTEDKFLVGAFDLAAQIFDRQNSTVEVSTEDGDNFIKNKVTIRAEERLALAIYRPEALVYGDFGRVV
ncbi:phage major capsid protein [Qipengyuania huizhouensis]|uniref:phage major capsid protein n=1 Tax=Qipengyuania huizhouensis TaxID=2867245 RepID=UPI001C86F24F|nr:phage major capsid protein [Qipengyuania huizhouensis]MBX7459548.1 phage major capsid protein [Qipengyuania huizhouensis]